MTVDPSPHRDDLTDNELAIRVTGVPDELGRVQFTVFWLDECLPPDGVRGQVFHTSLAAFVARGTARGRKVTALDGHTAKLIDAA